MVVAEVAALTTASRVECSVAVVIADPPPDTDFHIDDNNTSSYACPIPDFHICLTNNPMIAFTHFFS